VTLTLAEASAQVGVNRSTLLRSIKSGRLSGTRDEFGTWRIEPSELFRIYAPVEIHAPAAEAMPKAVPQDAQADALVADLRAQLAEMRQQRDAWQGMAERLGMALPKPEVAAPAGPPRSWWRRLCLIA
jgi:excisionase family DNA binding protein